MEEILAAALERVILLVVGAVTVYYFVVPILHQLQNGVTDAITSALGGK